MNAVVNVMKTERSKALKLYHMHELLEVFSDDVNLEDHEGEEFFTMHNKMEITLLSQAIKYF